MINQVRGLKPSRIDRLKKGVGSIGKGVGSIGKGVGHGLSSTYSGLKSMGSYLKGASASSASVDKDTNSLSDEDKSNIILKINETVDNGMKRVNIDILIPREGSDVIVRDWSKDTSQDTLMSISDNIGAVNKSDDKSVATSDASDADAAVDDNTINTVSTDGKGSNLKPLN